jgi:hypothetical protein
MDGWGKGRRLGRATGAWIGYLVACAFAAGEVAAQAPAAEVAEASATPAYSEAINDAIGHYSAGRWREAQLAFARAHALQPSARTYRGLGLAAFYLDEFAAAREAFEQALADSRKPLPQAQRRELVDLLAACARETGRVELRVAPPSARVELDGVVSERRVLFLGRGTYVLTLSAEGHVAERTTLTIAGGEERSLELSLAAVERQAAAPAVVAPAGPSDPVGEATAIPPDRAPPANASTAGGGRVFTWIAAAAVPVFASTAAAVWFTGKAERDAIEKDCLLDGCDMDETKRRSRNAGLDTYETWTNVSLAASGVALVAAAVLFVVERPEASGSGVEVSVVRTGATLRARF